MAVKNIAPEILKICSAVYTLPMIIDLSVRLNEDMPVYPGDPKLAIKAAGTFTDDGYVGHAVSMGTHAGTHIDAPAHMIEGTKTLDKFSIDTFVGRGRYILVKDNQFSLEAVHQAGIEPGDIVLFNTEMSYRFYDPVYFESYPVLSEEIARYLVEKKVKMVGLDTCSADNSDGFPVHKILLGANIPIIENLTNVEQLSGHDFRVYALPLRFDLDGAPARVVAEVI